MLSYLGTNLPELSALGLFAVVSFFVAASPGPTWVYVLSCAASHGRRTAYFSVLGNLFGIGFHVFLSSVGLSLLLASSEKFLFWLSEVGGLYLIYLGASRFRSATNLPLQNKLNEHRKWHIMVKTGLINILNPKVLLLFLTLLPQFADNAKSFFYQSLVFGLLHACIASVILCSVIEIFFVGRSHKNTSGSRVWVYFNWVGAVVICGFGIRLLLSPWGAWL